MQDVLEDIIRLKKEQDAIILAHYYVNEEVQKIADFVGDSYFLSNVASKMEATTIVLAGVRFMAEGVKILNPDKRVLLPHLDADCPMAHMVDLEQVVHMKKKMKDLAVVCYINSITELKALSDVCVTSSNAEKIVKSLAEKNILFLPDQHLGRYLASLIPDKSFYFQEGFCPTHRNITKIQVKELKQQFPNADVLVHPECGMDVIEMGDYIGSTSGIISYAKHSPKTDFIICTEQGVHYQLKQNNLEKRYHFIKETPLCLDMKRITLDQIGQALRLGTYEISVDEPLRQLAECSLKRMHELA